MYEHEPTQQQPTTRRRRRPTQMEIFKQTLLPVIIVAVTVVMIVIFFVGSISHTIQHAKLMQNSGVSASQDAENVVAQAKKYAATYDYERAVAIIDSFSGKKTAEMKSLKKEFRSANKKLVLWKDNSAVLHLSFEQLIADPQRAFANGNYNNHLTTAEFTKILQQLYENGYILIGIHDIVEQGRNDAGDLTLTAKKLYLPKGKKPLIITQTSVNYYTQMIDSDNDRFPDQDAPGFASRLLLDENNNLACEITNADGTTATGAYDLIPILESFITTHPDFSYKGAKAIVAMTGYDGLLGYRTTAEASEYFGPAYQKKQVTDAKAIVDALRRSGYSLACCTYGDISYGASEITDIRTDLATWKSEAMPILEFVDTFVFVKDGDIAAPSAEYSGEKFDELANNGFIYYIGYNNDGTPWFTQTETYLRQGRIAVSTDTIRNNPDWFTGAFDAATVLDSGR